MSLASGFFNVNHDWRSGQLNRIDCADLTIPLRRVTVRPGFNLCGLGSLGRFADLDP